MLISAGISSMTKSAAGQDMGNIKENNTDSSNGNDSDSFKVSIFSKHLQWLDYSEMAKVATGMGFDGVDLTVRPQGHVLPERVVEDLPKAVAAVRNAGMNVYMITTAIKNADDPISENILKTASSLGIRHYRMGYFYYDEKISVEESLKNIENQLTKLAALNKKYSIHGEYQNHSGMYFGAPIWDLHSLLKQINSPWIGSQYDVYHATVEGANTWPIGLKLLKPYIKSICVKDFQWTKKENKWMVETVPLGEGMTNFNEYFKLLKQYSIHIPISLHYEYPLGGAEHGDRTLTMEREEVVAVMKRDLITLRKLLTDENLINPANEK